MFAVALARLCGRLQTMGRDGPTLQDAGHTLLFNSSTTVTIGDGMKAQFWHHSWLDGEAPRNLAPHLFECVKRKNKTVHQELQNDKWIHSLRGKITYTTHIEEFVSLWIRFQNIHLQNRSPRFNHLEMDVRRNIFHSLGLLHLVPRKLQDVPA